MTKEEVVQAKREKALAKARAVKAENQAKRAKAEAARELKAKRAELEKIRVQVPELSATYANLLESLAVERFDRKKWNRLDSLQNNIIGRMTRQRTLENELKDA